MSENTQNRLTFTPNIGKTNYGVFSNTIFKTKGEFEKLENKRKIFNKLFPINEKEGFYMNQKIGNCYLISVINVMRLNPYFMDELYKNINFSNEDNIFKTKVSYIFPNGQKVIISIKDIKNQKETAKEAFTNF